MPGKCRPSLRGKTLENVMRSSLSSTDKECVKAVFERYEAEPVKHGRWVLKERAHYFKCSLCNEPIPYKFGYSESRRYYNYCPNCGAKMDGGNNDA